MALDQRFWNKVDIRGLNDCWEWQGPTYKTGYGMVNGIRRTKGVKPSPMPAHRKIMDDRYGPLDRWTLVRHKCGNKLCVNPLHLELGTHQDNMNDAKRLKETAAGEKNARAKLTAQDVLDIRSSSLSANDLGKKYNVDHSHIRGIKSRKYWSHI
jgi:hypothetical protein